MSITSGQKLPDISLTKVGAEGPEPITTADYFKGRKIVLFAVPGAFTPTCHLKHLPGFIEHGEAIKAKGVDAIACISVNDPFVMQAWAKNTGAENSIDFIADGNGDFATAIGLTLDGTGFGLGLRSQRYAMVVNDGTVETINVEEQAGTAVKSGAEAILAGL